MVIMSVVDERLMRGISKPLSFACNSRIALLLGDRVPIPTFFCAWVIETIVKKMNVLKKRCFIISSLIQS